MKSGFLKDKIKNELQNLKLTQNKENLVPIKENLVPIKENLVQIQLQNG